MKELDGGGMGRIFKAQHVHMQRTVAIKVMNNMYVGNAIARFRREIQLSAQLVHANIVTAFDAGRIDADALYLVMEFVDGTNLSDFVKQNGPVPVDQAVHCIQEAAKALAYLAKKNIVHRDVKPQNLMLTADGQVKLLDMGIVLLNQTAIADQSSLAKTDEKENSHSRGSRPASDSTEETALTSPNMIMGSASYMAPEQARSNATVDHRADIYGLGCTLYFLLTGEAPYQGQDALDVLIAHREEPIPTLGRKRVDVPQAISEVCKKAMAKKPESRFQSITEMSDALKEALEPKDLQRSRWMLAALLVGFVAILAGAIYRIETNHGTLVIESFDPDVKVSVEQNGKFVTILDLKTGNRAELKPGKFTLKVKDRQDLALSTDSFTMSRGTEKIVQVRRLPPSLPTLKAPFDAKTATASQSDYAKRLKQPVEWTNNLGMKFRLIPPGTMKLDSDYTVTLSKPYYLGKYEVTVGEFAQFVKQTNYVTDVEKNHKGGVKQDEGKRLIVVNKTATWKKHVFDQEPDEPVVFVSWRDAQEIAKWLSQRDHRKYRLPTHAEWEWAHAAGTTWKQSPLESEENLLRLAWIAKNSGARTHRVGQLKPNPYGLFDTFGNTSEWVNDWFDQAKRVGSVVDPLGLKTGIYRRIASGGNFCSLGLHMSGGLYAPNAGVNIFGFRLLCEIRPTKTAKQSAR